jgi:hypothetical protein
MTAYVIGVLKASVVARRPALARGFCAPVVPLADKVKANLEFMKAKIAEKPDSGYTAEALTAALASNTVDQALLAKTLDFSDEARKMASKLNIQASLMQKEMAKGTVADWAQFDGKVDAEIVAEVKGMFEAAVKEAESDTSGVENIKAVMKDFDAAMNGPGGLIEQATKEEIAAKAGMVQCIADMEKLLVDIEGVSDVTIGEILDREPEMRAEIEEEIKNNVWAP